MLYSLREGIRRRVLVTTAVLSALLALLFGFACAIAFDSEPLSGSVGGIDPDEVTGATLQGLAMFGALFLGAVLAGFLCFGTVRGDAERGLLQPLVVRPVGRSALLLGRFAAAASIAGLYTFAAYSGAVLIVGVAGGYWPSSYVAVGLELVLGVVVVAALAVLGSVLLSAMANGIAVFMLLGSGLLFGLLSQIGEAIGSTRLERIGEVGSWALPFEALYQDALSRLAASSSGATRLVVELGPFGGARAAGLALVLWSLAYVVVAFAVAQALFARRDL